MTGPAGQDDATTSRQRPARRPTFGPFTADGGPMPVSNRMPVAAVGLGVVSIPFGIFTGFLGLACAVLAIVLGAIGVRQVRRGTATRFGFAVIGIVTGGIGLVVSIVVLVISLHHINDCKKHIGHTPSAKELTQCAKDGI